jgi:hypothetical protein
MTWPVWWYCWGHKTCTTSELLMHYVPVLSCLQIITQDMRGFLIADDMASVVVLLGADEADFQHWQQHRQTHLQQQQGEATTAAAAAAGANTSPLGAAFTSTDGQSTGRDVGPLLVDQQQQQHGSSSAGWGRLKGHISRQGSGERAAVTAAAELRHSSSVSLDIRRGSRRKGAGLLMAQQRQLSPQQVLGLALAQCLSSVIQCSLLFCRGWFWCLRVVLMLQER